MTMSLRTNRYAARSAIRCLSGIGVGISFHGQENLPKSRKRLLGWGNIITQGR